MKRIKQQPRIIIELESESDYQETCAGCPTIFEFDDIDGHHLYFHLRHGNWRLYDETIDKVLAYGNSSSCDGICDWNDATEMMEDEGVYFDYN